MERKNSDRNFTLDDVRQVFREELSEVSFVASVPAEYGTADTGLTEEQQAENDENVLSDLTAFF